MTPAELLSLDRPILCSWCFQRLALAGEGSQYCETCNGALHPKIWKEDDRPVVYDGSELEPSARYPSVRGDQIGRPSMPDWLDEDVLSHFEEGE